MEVAINGQPNHGCEFKFKHLTASYAKILYKEYWDDYFKFSIVRNPWSRMVSMCKCSYFYGCRIENGKLNISKYIERWPVIEIDPRTNCHINDHSVIHDNSVYKNLLLDDLDFVGRFESLEEDFNFIKESIGLDLESFPCYNNQSSMEIKSKHYTEYYDKETKQRVSELYAQDIEAFNYKFGE